MTHLEIFHRLVSAGMRMRYGSKPDKVATLRVLWEKKHIIDAGLVDYYIMAFWIFQFYGISNGIKIWARGAVPSSIVCYCLGLTEIDPVKYDLYSVRFVNDRLPYFQFDIEASRFDEFIEKANELLNANAKDYDIPNIKKCLFRSLTSMEYLSKKRERTLPENIDDEMARYALSFPQTLDLYETYVQSPKCDILIYQEQMLSILKHTFHVNSIKANHIRLSIQRGETEQIAEYKKGIFANLKDITLDEAEASWQRLISNPKAFLKAHAVSRVVARYRFEMLI
jgi:DNA polymerase III alpha subunit